MGSSRRASNDWTDPAITPMNLYDKAMVSTTLLFINLYEALSFINDTLHVNYNFVKCTLIL